VTTPRRGLWRYAWLPLSAGLLGVLLGVHPLWWPHAQRMLLFIGQAKLAAVKPGLPGEVDKSDYLVVLRENEHRDDAERYFAEQSDIDYIGESIYPKTLVVALRVPVGASKKQLAAQPFARTVLPVLPIFFCH
jgi:hypothetical protein